MSNRCPSHRPAPVPTHNRSVASELDLSEPMVGALRRYHRGFVSRTRSSLALRKRGLLTDDRDGLTEAGRDACARLFPGEDGGASMITIDVTAILAEMRASTPHGLCPWCGEPGPVEARDPEPPHYASHTACDEREALAHYAFMAAECRVSAPVYLWREGGWGFGSWGPGTLLSYAAVALEALRGDVVLGAQPYFLEPEWW